ncbi:NADH-quinone oxidoreductase subunit NuoN [Mycolicibacterium agri]|uniref:NADH-quinone oxidoreductase subunit N n=1 Tax=Mycolicibacterium agri TaxID=36811 RepID=A0A2A7N974_MYCAG|nr:NADH-quinone oxidoreductase subunit NuoN [Mycolicibacterium agri]PEG40267.1 NADH-quinone oxidoreductase subunit NuoN [Mycolicibacterium agri]GFG55669.1 NADH-quinone oxidoreductase subunit N [Mycolicibacterium agri]
MNLQAPNVEYGLLSPMLIIFGAAIAGVLVEAFVSRNRCYPVQLALSSAALGAAFLAVCLLRDHHGSAVMGSVTIDGPTLFLQAVILLTALLALAPIAESRLTAFAASASSVPGSAVERASIQAGSAQTEVFPFYLLAVGGLLLFPASADLLTIFVALEVLSLPLYLMCALARHRRLLSHEAALKYFLLGALSSALFLYGLALLYGHAGTLSLTGIAEALARTDQHSALAVAGVALLTAGLLFKIGAVPFHFWVPDVYQGAPTPVTGFMAAATKLAAFGAMLRIFSVALPTLTIDWRPVLWTIAALTMVLAALLTVAQTDIKRLLAYSSVANVGFLLLGVSAGGAGLTSTLFYLTAYGFSTIGAFATVYLIRGDDGREETDTRRWAGLGRRSPALSAAMAVYLLGIAGIPLTSGFVSKVAIFQAAASDGAMALVVVGALSSAIAAYAYARVIVRMFFSEPTPQTPLPAAPARSTATVVGVAAAVTVLLGITPQPVLAIAGSVGEFLG